MIISLIVAWLATGIVSALWFYYRTSHYRPYQREWMRVLDTAVAFIYGPVGLGVNALIEWEYRDR